MYAIMKEINFNIIRPDLVDPETREKPWISPFVNLASIEHDLPFLDNKNDIVIHNKTRIDILIDFPLNHPCRFRIAANTPQGFTKEGLVLQIASVFQRLYAELGKQMYNKDHLMWKAQFEDLGLYSVRYDKYNDIYKVEVLT